MYNYNKLRGKIKEHCGNLAEYAKELNISTTTLTTRLNGDTFFNQKEIEKSVKILKLNDNEIKEIFFTEN
ncbi:MAG: DUF739 family protein [Parvimonas sp.]|jgi:conserved domain protein|nr:DUF739 family protein [Parvimonas sp.]DAL04156.1 MAG TPA: Protein of unknown function (DUF739) [Caudoviricetes sp.]